MRTLTAFFSRVFTPSEAPVLEVKKAQQDNSDLKSELEKILTPIKQLCLTLPTTAKDARTDLDTLCAQEWELKAFIQKYNLPFNLTAYNVSLLPLKPAELAKISAKLNAENITTLYPDLEKTLHALRMKYYLVICADAKKVLARQNQPLDANDKHAMRNAIVLELRDSLEKRNLLHIAALVNDFDLVQIILNVASQIGIDINHLDIHENSALQYVIWQNKLTFIDPFLSFSCDVTLLKDQNGRKLVDTLPRINSSKDLEIIKAHPLSKIALYNYLNQFYQTERLVEKMSWLQTIEVVFKTLNHAQDNLPAASQRLIETYFRLHMHTTPVRQELAIILGLNQRNPTEKSNAQFCITKKEYEILRADENANDDQYVFCLENLQEQFTQLQLDINASALDAAEKEKLNKLIRLQSASLEAFIYTLLSKEILAECNPVEQIARWEENKISARKTAQENIIKDSLSQVRILIEQTLQSMQNPVNLEYVISVLIEPLISSQNEHNLGGLLNKLDHAKHLIKPELSARWQIAKPHLVNVIQNTSVETRNNTHFGPLIAKFRIKLMIKAIQSVIEPAVLPEINQLFYDALCADTLDNAKTVLQKTEGLIDELSPARKQWDAFAQFILLQVTASPLHARKQDFNELKATLVPSSVLDLTC